MRNIISALIVFILCLGLVGCDKINKKPLELTLEPGKFDLYDCAIYDTKTEKQIYLGMLKKEVDKIYCNNIYHNGNICLIE